MALAVGCGASAPCANQAAPSAPPSHTLAETPSPCAASRVAMVAVRARASTWDAAVRLTAGWPRASIAPPNAITQSAAARLHRLIITETMSAGKARRKASAQRASLNR